MARVTVGVGQIGQASAGDSIYTEGLSDCVAMTAIDINNRKCLYHINGGNVEEDDEKFDVLEDFVDTHNNIIIIITYGTNSGSPMGRQIFRTQDRVADLLDNNQVVEIAENTSNSVEIFDPNGQVILG